MIKLTLISLFFLFNSYANSFDSKIIGGIEVNPNSKQYKASVGLISSNKGKLKLFCTGILIGPRVILTAAHCIDSSSSNTILASQGDNPLANNEKIKVSHFSYFKPSYIANFDSSKDFAVLVLESPFQSYEVAKIGNFYSLRTQDFVAQLGYGFRDFEMSSNDYPSYGKLQMLKDKSTVFSLSNK